MKKRIEKKMLTTVILVSLFTVICSGTSLCQDKDGGDHAPRAEISATNASKTKKKELVPRFKLMKEDVKKLKEIANIQEGVGASITILKWAPIASALGNPAVVLIETIFNTDMADMAQTMKSLKSAELSRLETECREMQHFHRKRAKHRKFWKVLGDRFRDLRKELNKK